MLDVNDLHYRMLVELKYVKTRIVGGDGSLAIVLAAYPKLRLELSRLTMAHGYQQPIAMIEA